MSEDVKGEVPDTTKEPGKGADVAQTLLKPEDAEKIAQSAADKVRTEYSQKLKAKDTEIEDLKRSKMSEKELREDREKKLAEKERELQRKELQIVAIDSLKDSKLSVDFQDFVLADTPEQTKARVLMLTKIIQKEVEAAVAEKFKQAGHDPAKGDPPKTSTFTREQLLKMKPDEIAKSGKLPEILKAMAEGQIK